MASILVYIELEECRAVQTSLSMLNEGRRIASRLGATLYAMLPCADPPGYDDDDIIAVLSRHGADKVLLLTHPDLGQDPPVELLEQVMRFACQRIPPRLVLFPTSSKGLELAPRLAIQLGGQYCSMDSLGIEQGGDDGEEEPGADDAPPRGLEVILQNSDPLVMSLAKMPPAVEMGDEEAEVVALHPPLPTQPA